MPDESTSDTNKDPDDSRLQLVWSVFVFQLKLFADGLRDVLLVPVSIIAAVLGLLFGGSQPSRLFDEVLRFGRRTEHWINLFGYRRRRGTADELLDPVKEKVFQEADANPLLQRAGARINRSLDQVNERLNASDEAHGKADSGDDKA